MERRRPRADDASPRFRRRPQAQELSCAASFLRIDSRRSLARLDELTRELRYLPATTTTWRAAARLWADQRREGIVTGEGLDGDVLIAAQAIEEAAAIVTLNEKHFERLVDAFSWTAVPLADT